MTVTVAAKARTLPERWTVHHDNRLRDTDGKYAAIAALSDEWGVESRVLLARLHRLRAGDVASAETAIQTAVPCEKTAEEKLPRVSTPDSLPSALGLAGKAVKGKVTPPMHRIVCAIEARGTATCADLVEALGTNRNTLMSTKTQNRAALAAAGWQIASDGERPATYWMERVS